MKVYPKEFEDFFSAMSAKMLAKSLQYGDTWKNETLDGTDTPMGAFLHERLEGEIKEYFASGEPMELVDISNICAMLWIRAKWDIAKHSDLKPLVVDDPFGGKKE